MTSAEFRRGLPREVIDAGDGVLRLRPTWVPRSFASPGRRLRLAERDLYRYGAHRGGIDERWLASTTPADNGPLTTPDEGLSYVLDGDSVGPTLAEVVAAEPETMLGRRLTAEYGRWPVYAKFFDNDGPLPHHLHHRAEHAAAVGREPKPEAYYFPPQMNATPATWPISFFGLEAGTSRDEVSRCLERWDEGDNGILDLARGFRLERGTGWVIPPGVLHAPGSFCTFEVQWGSDVFSMFQSMVDGRPMPRDVLMKDVPADRQGDYEFVLDLVDWDANTDPALKAKWFRRPAAIGDTAGRGYVDRWVIYGLIGGRDYFAARELTVQPGASVRLVDPGASGLVVVQGTGRIGRWPARVTSYVRFGELTADEFFVSAAAAAEGIEIENTGHDELVLLRYFGPDVNAGMPTTGGN